MLQSPERNLRQKPLSSGRAIKTMSNSGMSLLMHARTSAAFRAKTPLKFEMWDVMMDLFIHVKIYLSFLCICITWLLYTFSVLLCQINYFEFEFGTTNSD